LLNYCISGRLEGVEMGFNPNLVFDVGLHMGEDTEFYLKKGFNVVAFEANPTLVQHCKHRFSAQITSGQLHIIEGAIAPDECGDYITFFESSNSIWGTIDPEWDQRNLKLGASSKRIDVQRVDISSVFSRFGVPFYLKIDVEGVDGYVVDKLRDLSALPKYISIESEKVDFQKLQSELGTLKGLGYNKFKIVQQERIPGQRIVSNDIRGKQFEHTFSVHSSGVFGEELPGSWLNYEQALERYTKIFLYYRLFGDGSFLHQIKLARIIRKIGRRIGIPLPGWHDTHASL
jgi:FkbM family methyltransferase